jgi:transcriptional regulator with XRE-family HTH domain
MDNSLRIVVSALLNQRKMTQNELARELDTTTSNLSTRLKVGSMKSGMIKKISEFFDVDILDFIRRYESGESIQEILNTPEKKILESIELELSPEEVKEVLLNAKRDQEELKEEFHQLVAQVKTWIQHDLEKSRRQEELINMLLEERAEYKAKKK